MSNHALVYIVLLTSLAGRSKLQCKINKVICYVTESYINNATVPATTISQLLRDEETVLGLFQTSRFSCAKRIKKKR